MVSGLICMSLFHCVFLSANVSINVVEFTEPYCLREVRGCALYNESRVILKQDSDFDMLRATLFHELLHFELGPEHTEEFLIRDNAYRDYLGVHDRYLLPSEIQTFKKKE